MSDAIVAAAIAALSALTGAIGWAIRTVVNSHMSNSNRLISEQISNSSKLVNLQEAFLNNLVAMQEAILNKIIVLDNKIAENKIEIVKEISAELAEQLHINQRLRAIEPPSESTRK